MMVILLSATHSAFAAGDALKEARAMIAKKKFHKASKVLKIYIKAHPDDAYGKWLAAQTEHWSGNYKASIRLYTQTLQALPGNYALIIDYAKTLMDYSELNKASKMLQAYQTDDPKYVEARMLQARIDYWRGDYRKAQDEVNKISTTGKDIDALKADISLAKSPWFSVSTTYLTDNQPIKIITPDVSGGVWLHPLANIYVGFQTPIFVTGNAIPTAQSFYAGNRFHFQNAGIDLSVDAGVTKLPFHNTAIWTGNIYLRKTLLKQLFITLSLAHSPYLSTLASLDTPVTSFRYSLSADWNDQHTVNGKASVQIDQFPLTGNYNTTIYAYAFAPTLKASVFDFRFGYGYSFSTSRYNAYSPENSLAYIIANYTSAAAYTGIYDPYFTPSHQQIHAALANITIHPASIVDIGLSANVGFYATIANPYLYLDKTDLGTTYVAKAYYKATYVPIEANAWIGVKVSKKVSLKAEYAYHRTYFFDSHFVGLSARFSFWK